jgi:hypothetical protein
MNKLFRCILPALLVFAAHPATAQRAAEDPDWNDGSIPVTDFSTWSNKPTGSAPADAYEPAEPAGDLTYNITPWTTTRTGAADTPSEYAQSSPTTQNRKFRTTCEPSTARRQDFILGFGVSSFGHMHEGTGNIGWNQNSTYLTARAAPASTCAGGPLNPTNYIEPAVMELLSTGARAVHRSQVSTFYYVSDLLSDQGDPLFQMTWLRRDFSYILGASPSNYNDTARRAIYAAASPALYYPGSPDTPAGMVGIQCFTNANALVSVTRTNSQMKLLNGTRTNQFARHWVAEDGSDPWGGNCVGTTAAPGYFIINLRGEDCWDRYNLHAPDGRMHVWYSAQTTDSAHTKLCPTVTVNGVLQNYAYFPELNIKTEYRHAGWNDYKNWYLESDRMHVATTECPDAASACDGVSGGNVPATVNGVFYSRVSLDPCRATSINFCNGSTFHADWGMGWMATQVFDLFQRECLGITVRGVAPVYGPAECDDSRLSPFLKMKSSGASPDPTLSSVSGVCSSMVSCTNAVPGDADLYEPVEVGQTGPFTIEGGHNTH